jgi:hypothetical protein
MAIYNTHLLHIVVIVHDCVKVEVTERRLKSIWFRDLNWLVSRHTRLGHPITVLTGAWRQKNNGKKRAGSNLLYEWLEFNLNLDRLVKVYEGARANVLPTAFVGIHSSVGNIFCPALSGHSQRR